MAANTASAVTIRELTGQQRSVKLEGRSLPYRPTTFHGEQRLKRSDYTGSSTPTVQVLGPKEGPLELKGTWKDKFLGEGVAQSLQETFDSIRRSGQELEIQWDRFIRRGFLRIAKFTVLRTQDIEWTMEFEIRTQGEPDTPVTATFVSVGAQQDAEGAALQASLEASKGQLEGFLGRTTALGRFLNGTQQVLDRIQAFRDSATGAIFSARLSLDQARNVIARARALRDSGGVVLREADGLLSDVQAAGRGLQNVLSLELAKRQVEADALGAIALAVRAEENALAFIEPDIVGSVFLAVNQDLRGVAAKFLGTADAWEQLADFNGLVGSAQPAGTLILIPRV